jgi:hypothetical protein
MAPPETLKLNDILPFQKVVAMGNSSSKLLLCQLFLGMSRSATWQSTFPSERTQ